MASTRSPHGAAAAGPARPAAAEAAARVDEAASNGRLSRRSLCAKRLTCLLHTPVPHSQATGCPCLGLSGFPNKPNACYLSPQHSSHAPVGCAHVRVGDGFLADPVHHIASTAQAATPLKPAPAGRHSHHHNAKHQTHRRRPTTKRSSPAPKPHTHYKHNGARLPHRRRHQEGQGLL